ncbi:hypothetical protein SCP_1801390 [Sparassis crispa]|uniref:Uncharacterized protein n=1 Tax=Sparassis crispa TaxID=139825 RepID=A0A401H6Q0_9APHY|nr:hypothetical protein SCP_1801390 [Sparassis crispa]GBE90115.1 hypothetical protein SCP_1801390 [Sparassis crispa]
MYYLNNGVPPYSESFATSRACGHGSTVALNSFTAGHVIHPRQHVEDARHVHGAFSNGHPPISNDITSSRRLPPLTNSYDVRARDESQYFLPGLTPTSRHSPLHQEDASMDSQINPYSHHVSSSLLTLPTRQVEPSIKYGGNDASTQDINGMYGTDWSYDTVARYQAIQSGGHNDNPRAGGTAFVLRREHNHPVHIPSPGKVEDSYPRYIRWPHHPTGECLLRKAVCSSTSGDGEPGSLSPVSYPANMPQVPGSPNICHPTIHLPPPVPVHTQPASKTAAHNPARLPPPRDGPLPTPPVAPAGEINLVDSLETLRADVGLTPDQPLNLLSLPDRTDDCKPEYS